ncbi:MAG: hypothetical protein ACK5KP_04590, partial [Paludibacteraceae bacterium]
MKHFFLKFTILLPVLAGSISSCGKDDDSGIMGNDCEIITFNSNYSNNYTHTDVFFVKGVKLKTVYHGMQLKVIEDIKQNLQEDKIMVWCSDGNSFRSENAAWYNNNDTLYLLITKTDLEGND